MCWVWLTLHCHGQDSRELDIAPPAESRVDDKGGFFKGSGTQERISQTLQQLGRDRGYIIHLVVEPVLIGTTPQELAARLRQAWLPEGNGLVIVFESDSGAIGVGRDLEHDVSEQPLLIPSFETAAMINRAVAAVDRDLQGEAFVESLMTEISSEFDRYFQQIEAPAPVERSLRIAMLAVGTLSLLGLVAIGVGTFIRHSSMAAVERFQFPEVDALERLGAPCGGSVTARRFAQQGAQQP